MLPLLLLKRLGLPVLTAIGVALAWVILGRRKRRAYQRGLLREQWGRPDALRDRDWRSLNAFHRARVSLRTASWKVCHQLLTDAEAADLDLESVFGFLDRTLTGPGQHVLLDWLRSNAVSDAALAELEERNTLAAKVVEDAATRDAMRVALDPLGSVPDTAIDILWSNVRMEAPPRRFVYLLSGASVLALCLLPVLGAAWGTAAVATMLALSTWAHAIWNRFRAKSSAALNFLGRLLATGGRLGSVPLPGFEQEHAELAALLKKLRPLSRALVIQSLPSDDVLYILIVYLLVEEHRLLRATALVEKHRGDLQQLFELVGRLDALQALASVRTGPATIAVPRFRSGTPGLEVEGLFHPLLATPVSNDLQLQGGLLITGSNMAGKSTFLRTLGLNVLLAQSMGFSFARRYEGTFLRLAPSLHRGDGLLEGKSSYLAEAQSVLAVTQTTEHTAHTLVLLDELFKGTGTTERIAGAAAVLRYLASKGALVVAATHDRELTELLSPLFALASFEERIDASGLVFDYRLKPGVASKHNALALLERLGFPSAVVAEARRLATDRSAPKG